MRILHIFILLAITVFSCAEEKQMTEARGFNEQKLAELNASSRFDYDRTIDTYENPLLEILFQFISWVASFFNLYLGYFVLAVLLGVLVYLIVKSSSAIFPGRSSNYNDSVVQVKEENIEAIDYDLLLKKALEDNDYRLAIRYSFLMALKMLQQAGLIDWHREKTNYQYLFELPEHHRSDFRRIISYFEYTWYGRFDATEAIYKKVDEQARIFREKIKMKSS